MSRPGLSKGQFETVFRSGKRVVTPHFRVSASLGVGRIGIATAKKIGCHARRNWVKRRIRESINSLESHLKPQIDYILIASPSVVLLSFEETTAALQDALDRMASRWAEVSESS